MKSIQSVLLLGLSLVFLTNCSSLTRSHVGAGLGGTTTTAVCVENGITDPYAVAGCNELSFLQKEICKTKVFQKTNWTESKYKLKGFFEKLDLN